MRSLQPPRNRIGHIDSIRGIAALMVAWMHCSAILASMGTSQSVGSLLYVIPHQLDFGRVGVIAFFAISGFVICPSLKGSGMSGAGGFVISRFFRLYPAFWLAMACAILIMYVLPGREIDTGQVLGNIPMLYSFFDVQPLQGLYWTLEVELVFYCLCLGVFLLGWLHKPLVLFAICLSLLLLQAVINANPAMSETIITTLNRSWNRMPWHLAIMFWGGLFRIWYDDRHGVIDFGRLRIPKALPVAVVLLLILRQPLMSLFTSLSSGFEWVNWGMLAYLWGMLFFLVGALYVKLNNRVFVWLGAISYSLYLLHPLAARLLKYGITHYFPQYAEMPLGVTLAASLLLAVMMSACVYYCVEKPSISLGRSLQKKWLSYREDNGRRLLPRYHGLSGARRYFTAN